MLIYLLNCTAIWLLALVVYDMMLRREVFHAYNRFYLLCSFVFGLLVPLLAARSPVFIPAAGQQSSFLHRAVAAKDKVVQVVSASPTKGVEWVEWLWFVYALGMLIASFRLVVEGVKLYRMYRAGTTRLIDGMTIVETGTQHAPFSFLSCLFVGSKAGYTAIEWQMIVAHERRHMDARHYIDLFLLRLAAVVFWWHPLVYVYKRRLLMVHEFQADEAAVADGYMRFLAEQSLLHTAPSFTHSFNRSPLKYRISMLNKISAAGANRRKLVAIPVLLMTAVIVAVSGMVIAQNGSAIAGLIPGRGKTCVMNEPKPDSVYIIDPVTGKEELTMWTPSPHPVSIDGRKVYEARDVATPPAYRAGQKNLPEYIISGLEKELLGLGYKDGSFGIGISNVVVDESGHPAWFWYDGIVFQDEKGFGHPVTKDLYPALLKVLSSAPPLIPASVGGKPVMAVTDIALRFYKVSVSDGQLFVSRLEN